MSLSALPEWKQLLLERKRRDEEEKDRREREEEERLASMPAWKREIIQRRKAKQDEEREREREKDGAPDVSAIVDEVIVTEQMDTSNQLSKETSNTIRHNPFIRSENSWRRDNRENNTNTGRGRTVETEKDASRGKEREFWKDRDMRIERTENKSEGRDRCTGREQVKKCRDTDNNTSLFSPVTGLRTIKANNIIIIEKERKGPERRESAREELHREEKRMRMDLREFLAGGGSVTEIRASEVLIIKPPVTDEKAETPEVQERVSSRERLERERMWRKEREMERDQRAENEAECGGRVSQLLSKFGEVPKPPVRSKSTDCFNRARYSTGDLHVQEDEDTRTAFRGVPKRSFSFSDRVLCPQENGGCEEELEFRVVERTYSDRRDRTESETRVTRRWGRQKDRNQPEGEEGFMVASVKNPEGIAFARRVQIKKDGREKTRQENLQTDTKQSKRTWNQDEAHDYNTSPSDRDAHPVSQQTEDPYRRTERVQDISRTFSCEDPDVTNKQTTDTSHSQHTSTPSQNKPCTHETVTIPTTVFYGVDVSARKTGDGAGLERRGSWKAGRPLTRVESLRERIRQREENGTEGTEVTAVQQEESALQTLRPFDVTQDVTVAESNPQLPVPVSLSNLQSEREVGEISSDECESDLYRGETERASARHVEERGERSVWRRQDIDVEDDETERELLEEEYLPPSLSPSPPLSDSLDEMSRIYNLKAVGSRSAVCISERKADLSTHNRGSQGQYNPIRSTQSPDILPQTAKLWSCGTARDGDKTEESAGVQTVQSQVERLQLKEQEEGCGSLLTEQEVKTAEGQKRPDLLKETPKTPTNPRFPQVQQKAQKSQQLKSFTVNARNAQPTENTSSSPSPPLFSIRSASGGAGKRGTTITITPRRSGAVNPSAGTRAVPQGQTPTTNTSGNRETNKKRYPTAEEIEVIGGYQNLERSCLVKSRGTQKAVKVCFDDIQLERVCEYPSEDCTPESVSCAPHPGSEDGRCGGEQEEEEDEENTGKLRILRVDESCKR